MNIGFMREPNIGILNIEENGVFKWEPKLRQDDRLFEIIENAIHSGGFDYYYYKDDILIIPDPRELDHPLSTFELGRLSFQTRGEFVLFFRIEKKTDGVILANSLDLTQFYYIQNNLKKVNNVIDWRCRGVH
ncbi:MAG: hypothetical protein K2G70_02010 [Turicibacter sp.]|nr:hypothetical protein [Turicibacter sp.]